MAENIIQKNPEVAVQVLIRNPADQKLLIMKSKQWEGQYEVMRGLIKEGETMIEATLRIVREKIGVETKDPELISIQESIYAKEFSQPHHFIFFGYVVNLVGIIPPETMNQSLWVAPYDAQTFTMTDTTREFVNIYVKRAREQA